MFEVADKDFIETFGEELKNHDGTPLKSIIKHKGKHWAIFPEMERYLREKAVFIIGHDIVNIPEILLLSDTEKEEIKKIIELDFEPIYLIRISQEYDLEELPLKDLDSAFAGQLVLCTLIRKRDDHEFNWSYIEGDIPIFYDSHVAFGWDKNMKKLEDFFSAVGLGYAGSWRIIPTSSKIDVKKNWRVVPPYSTHYIYNIEAFKSRLQEIGQLLIQRIEEKNAELRNINITISSGESLVDFLSYTTQDLKNTIDYLLSMILRQ